MSNQPTCGNLTPHPAHTTDRGHAPWHHCPGAPNLAEPAAPPLDAAARAVLRWLWDDEGGWVLEDGMDADWQDPEQRQRALSLAGAVLAAHQAAQQPLSRGERLRRNHAAQRIGRVLASLPEEVYLQLDAGYLEQACAAAAAEVYERAIAARDARVRADERRRVAEEIAEAIETHHAAGDLTAIQSARIARHHAAAPAERVQDAPTNTAGTPDPQRYWWQHDDCDSATVAGAADWPGRPCTGCGMSLGGWTRGAPITREAL